MAGLDLPIIPITQTFAPKTVVPKDLTGLIDAFQSNYADSFNKARGIADEGIIGNSRANAAAATNRATAETANQNTVDQTGRKVAPSNAGSNFDWSLFSTEELQDLLKASK